MTPTPFHPRRTEISHFCQEHHMQSTISTTCLVSVSEDMSEIASLEITFKGQFNKVNKVLSFDTSTSISEIISLGILSRSLQLNIGSCLRTRLLNTSFFINILEYLLERLPLWKSLPKE